MRIVLRSIVVVALMAVGLIISNRLYAVPFAPLSSGGPLTAPYVEGEVLVKFHGTVPLQDRTASVAARSHSVLANLTQPGWVHVKVGAGQTVTQALAAYRNDPRVEYVQPNYVYHATAVPNDTQYGQLWAFKNTGQTITTGTYTPDTGTPGKDINIEKAWDHITDCSSVVVAVVDSGVNYNQEDLAGNMWDGGASYPNHGWNYVDDDNDPMDLNGHGTHVAGTIGAAGNNSKGVTGVCWKASIMAVRVMDALGRGTTADIIQGVNFAVTKGAKVINMSLGGGVFDQAYSDAITNAQSNDVVVVVAAGNEDANNDSGTTPSYPCNFTQSNIICVAALDQNYQLANFSNYGTTSVDVGAPGTNIVSTWTGTHANIPEALTSGWNGSSTTPGGWWYKNLSGTQFLVNPGAFPTGLYNNSTDDRAWKTFNLAGRDVAILQSYYIVDVMSSDYFRIGYTSAGGDPFTSGTIVGNYTDVATYPDAYLLQFDISGCIGATCGIGFQLQTNATLADRGVGVTGMNIKTLTLNTTTYNTIDGTSMATPEVAGLVTMLRAYNPQYTYVDAVNAITNGGRATASLAGKTTTGKAIDAVPSLAYISPPTGLSATVD